MSESTFHKSDRKTVDETSHGALVHTVDQPVQSHDATAKHSGTISDGIHGSRGASLHADSHAQIHGAASHSGDVLPDANQDAGAFYEDRAQIAAPANPVAGVRRLFVDSADGKLKVRTSVGTSISLEEQGGGVGASLTRIGGASGAAGADLTWQILTANSVDVTTVALSAAVMTTTGVGVGTWYFKYILLYQTAATTTGIAFGINHTGTVTKLRAQWTHVTTGGAAATGVGDSDTIVVAGQLAEGKQDFGLNAIIGSASAGVDTINTDIIAVVEGIIVVSASGSLELRIASEIAGSAVRITASSMLELHKIA